MKSILAETTLIASGRGPAMRGSDRCLEGGSVQGSVDRIFTKAHRPDAKNTVLACRACEDRINCKGRQALDAREERPPIREWMPSVVDKDARPTISRLALKRQGNQ